MEFWRFDGIKIPLLEEYVWNCNLGVEIANRNGGIMKTMDDGLFFCLMCGM